MLYPSRPSSLSSKLASNQVSVKAITSNESIDNRAWNSSILFLILRTFKSRHFGRLLVNDDERLFGISYELSLTAFQEISEEVDDSKKEFENSNGSPQLLPPQNHWSWELLKATYVTRSISIHLMWNHLSQPSHWIPFWLLRTGFSQTTQGNFQAGFLPPLQDAVQSGPGLRLISPLVVKRIRLKVATEFG